MTWLVLSRKLVNDIYAYVGGNPISSVDFKGLANGGAAQMWMKGSSVSFAKVDDPCVQKALNDTYGDIGGFIANLGNIQQFFPGANSDWKSAGRDGIEVGAEKGLMSKVPSFTGKALMSRAIPGSIGGGLGAGLSTFGGVASGVFEVATAAMTPFSSVAMMLAQESCGCQGKK